ncbi:MAG: hypothetical protein NTW33_12665 [Methanoregula sp.]|nr:hypothetical protein [Methanoregula sp.]
MDNRFSAVCFFLILALLAVSAGCASAPAQQGVTAPVSKTLGSAEKTVPAEKETASRPTAPPAMSIADQLSAVKSDNAIWREAYRMFRNMRSTEYVHPPYTVDDAAGVYKFDCLGFVDHVLMNADPAAYKEIGRGVNPSIESYSGYFTKLDTTTPNALMWTKVAYPIDLKPGDVCLWLKPSTLDAGHMWIIAGEPKVNPKRGDEVLIRIFDSDGVHSDDSRTAAGLKNGLGSGIMGMMVDDVGNPIGLYWEGGSSTGAGEKDTTIVCGRLNQ